MIFLVLPKIILFFLIIMTSDQKSIKNYHYDIETQQCNELFTNEYLDIAENLRTKTLNEQFSIYTLSKLKFKNYNSYFKYILLLSGDINLHPGPVNYPCSVCNGPVRRKQISCNECNLWVHKKCVQISDMEFKLMLTIPQNDRHFICSICSTNIDNPCNIWDQLPFPEECPDKTSDIVVNETPHVVLNETSEINIGNVSSDDNWRIFQNRGLHFIHLNINSLLSKIDELRLIAKKSKATIIGITESKLDGTVLDGEINIDGYELVRSDRNRHGGGVACYIKQDVSFNVRGDFSTDLENIF